MRLRDLMDLGRVLLWATPLLLLNLSCGLSQFLAVQALMLWAAARGKKKVAQGHVQRTLGFTRVAVR